MLCVQVTRRPIQDGLGANLRDFLTCSFWCLKYRSDLTVLSVVLVMHMRDHEKEALAWKEITLRECCSIIP